MIIALIAKRTVILLLAFAAITAFAEQYKVKASVDQNGSRDLQAFASDRVRKFESDNRKGSILPRWFTAVFAESAAAAYPAELLLWLDVIKPTRDQKDLPTNCGGFETESKGWDGEFVSLEYSGGDVPKPEDKRASLPSNCFVPAKCLFPCPRNCIWVRRTADGNKTTTATVLLSRAVRRARVREAGTLRLLKVFRLQRDNKAPEFKWVSIDSDIEFDPVEDAKKTTLSNHKP